MPQTIDVVNHSSDPNRRSLGDVHLAESPGELQGVEVPHGIGNVEAVKLSPPHHAKDDRTESSRRNSMHPEHVTDNASVHSLPVAHVTEPEPIVHRRPSTARGAGFSGPPRSPTSTSRSQTPQEDLSIPQSNRRLHHRPGPEVGGYLVDPT